MRHTEYNVDVKFLHGKGFSSSRECLRRNEEEREKYQKQNGVAIECEII